MPQSRPDVQPEPIPPAPPLPPGPTLPRPEPTIPPVPKPGGPIPIGLPVEAVIPIAGGRADDPTGDEGARVIDPRDLLDHEPGLGPSP